MQSFLKNLVVILAFGYLAVAFAAFLFQRSLLYFPTHVDQKGQGTREFHPLLDAKGDFVGYVRVAEETKRVAIFFHGNGGEAIDRAWLGGLIPFADVALILAEHPGYGGRGGEPSEASLTEAARALVKLARDKWGVPVTLIGESLGTGVAASAVKEEGVQRLALISPFHSIQEIAQARFPFLPMEWLLRDKYLSYEYLKDVNVPLYVIHGTADDIVPFASGEKLYKEYGGLVKTMTALEGVGHNDIVPHLLSAPKAEEFRAFVRTN